MTAVKKVHNISGGMRGECDARHWNSLIPKGSCERDHRCANPDTRQGSGRPSRSSTTSALARCATTPFQLTDAGSLRPWLLGIAVNVSLPRARQPAVPGSRGRGGRDGCRGGRRPRGGDRRAAGRPAPGRHLPFVERRLPAGRHQFPKEQMTARIRQDLRTTTGTPRRNPFPRRAVVLLPAPACALADAVMGDLAVTGRDGNSLTTRPALTPRIGTADGRGGDRLLDFLLVARPTPSAAKELRASVRSVERRRFNDEVPGVCSRLSASRVRRRRAAGLFRSSLVSPASRR